MYTIRPHSDRHTFFVGMCLCMLLIMLLSACSSQGNPAQTPSASARNKADIGTTLNTLFTSEARQENFSGTILVMQNGKTLFKQAYGMANSQQNVRNTPETRFRIANLAEQFNALAILLLQNQGKLRVQDNICDYITGCPPTWDAITISQLLTHTSGLTDYTTLSTYDDTKAEPTTLTQLINRFNNQPLAIKASSTPAWNASDEVLLGLIIEQASGESYSNYLQHAILDPLHLKNTGYDQNAPFPINHATGYKQPHVPADAVDISVLYAAAGLYSTIDDLYTFDQALIQHQIASQQTLDSMFTPQWVVCKPGASCGSRYSEISIGYGWIIGKEKANKNTQRPVYFDNGSFEGFSASNVYYPDQKITVIWLSNIQNLQLDVDSMVQNALFPNSQS